MNPNDYESGISIYPAFFKLSLTKGQVLNLSLNVQNYQSVPATIKAHGAAFAQNPSTLQNYIVTHETYSDWISSSELNLPAKSTTLFPFTVAVPADLSVHVGSYYPAIVLEFETTADTTMPRAKFEHAIPLYIEITEEAVAEIQVLSFDSAQYVIGSSIDINSSITNIGNTYTTPVGYIEFQQLGLVNPVMKTRIETEPVNTHQTTLLPKSVLSETTTWNREMFGHYEATLYITAGEESLPSESVDFWIIPYQVVIAATAIAAFVIAASLLLLFKKLKRKKPPAHPPKRLAKYTFSLRKRHKAGSAQPFTR